MSVLEWKKCFSEPKQMLKLVAIIMCLCVACYQLSECFHKIIRPPISTYYNFQLNDTLSFPSLTICRNPAFKTAIFPKYNISINSKVKYHNAWRNFNFAEYTMDQFFEESTYSLNEVIPFFGFDTLTHNVVTSSFFNSEHGRCFVFTPINESTAWSSPGYYLYLNHTEVERKLNTNGVSLSGYHTYIHDRRDVYSGPKINDYSLMDYVYIEIGEVLRLNLKVQNFIQIRRKENNCNDTYHYSRSKCETDCLFKRLTEEIGCSTPWITNENLPLCNNYNQTADIIKLYDSKATQYISECSCPIVCHLRLYSPYLENRKDVGISVSELFISFSSNIVTVMKEIPGYDWNLFISDLGGSLGFLLGISVLGVIGALEHVIQAIKKSNERLILKRTTSIDEKKAKEFDVVKRDKGKDTKSKKGRNGVLQEGNQYTPQMETHDFITTKY